MATSAAQGGGYKLARDLYAELLKIDPDYPHARSNHDQVAKIVEDINRLSKSQAEERPPSSDSVKKSAKYNPQDVADGAEQRSTGKVKRQVLSATDVLKSEAATERWLRDISRNPRDFIRSRFQYEYTAGVSGEPGEPGE
jgi:Ca-activated chloride channel family protein